MDSFAEFWNGLIEGKGTIDDVKKSFALLVDEADAFRATIAKMKNDQLKRMLAGSRGRMTRKRILCALFTTRRSDASR